MALTLLATLPVLVDRGHKKFSAQLRRSEHCLVDAESLVRIGSAVGRQIRVRRMDDYAVYTVTGTIPAASGKIAVVRMRRLGRLRLGSSEPFTAEIESFQPHASYDEKEARIAGELIERLDDDGYQRRLAVLAPHGGAIERHTDEQAERVGELLRLTGATVWRCKGWRAGGGSAARWHITSTEIHPASFPKLAKISSRGFEHAVAFHGFSQPRILIGGLAALSLRQEIQSAIRESVKGSSIPVDLAAAGEEAGGSRPENLVNRITRGGSNGIQIEQSAEARAKYGREIADAVARVFGLMA